MKKGIIISAALAFSVAANAYEINSDEAYFIGTLASSTIVSGSATGFGAGVGAPLEGIVLADNSELFVEVGFNLLGESNTESTFVISNLSTNKISVKNSASTIYALGKLKFPIEDNIHAYGKFGLNRVSVSSSTETINSNALNIDLDSSFDSSSSSINLLFGGGIEFQIDDKISATGEYILYGSGVSSFAANLLYKF